MTIDIGNLLRNSWGVFSKSLVTNILIVVVGSIAASLVGALTLGILGIPIYVGIIKALRKAQQGGTAEFSDLFSEFGNISKWFMLWVLWLGVGLVSAITFGLGALAAGFLLYFTTNLMLEKDMQAFDAAKASFDYVSKNFGVIFVPILVCMLVSGAGSIAIYIGALITVPWMMIAQWDIYDAAFGEAAE